MSKLTNAIDAKSLVIGVLLTVVVFMSMGANLYQKKYHVYSQFLNNYRATTNGVPFAVVDERVYYYRAESPPKPPKYEDPLEDLFGKD